jgi:hypothetical protein
MEANESELQGRLYCRMHSNGNEPVATVAELLRGIDERRAVQVRGVGLSGDALTVNARSMRIAHTRKNLAKIRHCALDRSAAEWRLSLASMSAKQTFGAGVPLPDEDPRKPTARTGMPPLEGSYVDLENTNARLLLRKGNYQWGSREIFEHGKYKIITSDKHSVLLAFASALLPQAPPKKYTLTRRGRHYVLTEVSRRAWETVFTREDGKVFLANTLLKAMCEGGKKMRRWKQLNDSNQAVSFYLTGESVIRAVTVPKQPKSSTPTIVRISHSNCYGPVDSDIYIRLGDPKKPLGVQDFYTVPDWRKATLVEELIDNGGWTPRAGAKGTGFHWSGTYELEVQFPKGWHQVELKVISRIEQVCSIVLSNWKVFAR